MMGITISLATLSISAFACPKGSSLQGGTGPHHKGGKCVSSNMKMKKADPKK